ncbi:MAG: sterol desaturase family protein, partial [Pseudomonadota bacterium]
MEAFLAWKAVVVAVWFIAFFAAERLRPSAPRPSEKPGLPRTVKNGALWACNAALSPLLVLPLTAAAAAYGPDWRPEGMAFWASLALDLLILDLWIYWQHRAYHQVPALWRLHEPHHLDETLDVTSAVRFHFGEVAVSAVEDGRGEDQGLEHNHRDKVDVKGEDHRPAR